MMRHPEPQPEAKADIRHPRRLGGAVEKGVEVPEGEPRVGRQLRRIDARALGTCEARDRPSA